MVKRNIVVGVVLLAAGTVSAANDPTRPHNWSAAEDSSGNQTASQALKLNQIIAFGLQRYAIINGQRYQRDDQINGFRITAIESQRVQLQNEQQELELTMFKQAVKRTKPQQGEIE